MNRRVTITIDADVETALRRIQAEEMTRTNRATSFSHILNQILKEGIKIQLKHSEFW